MSCDLDGFGSLSIVYKVLVNALLMPSGTFVNKKKTIR